jgi:hypothetical protein
MRAPAAENVPYWLTAMKVLSSLSIGRSIDFGGGQVKYISFFTIFSHG